MRDSKNVDNHLLDYSHWKSMIAVSFDLDLPVVVVYFENNNNDDDPYIPWSQEYPLFRLYWNTQEYESNLYIRKKEA